MYPHDDHLGYQDHSKHLYLWCGCVRDDSRDGYGCRHSLDHDLGGALVVVALLDDNLGSGDGGCDHNSGDGAHNMGRSNCTSTSRSGVGYSRCSSSSRTTSSEDSPTMSSRRDRRGSSSRSSMATSRSRR